MTAHRLTRGILIFAAIYFTAQVMRFWWQAAAFTASRIGM